MCGLKARDAPKPRHEEDCRQEIQSLSAHREQRGLPGVADVLEQHVGGGAHAHQREGDTLPAQGLTAHADELGVFATEPRDHVGREDIDDSAQDNQKSGGQLDAEKITLLDPSEQLGAEVIAAHGLEALSEPDDDGEAEHGDARHDGEGRHGGGLVAGQGVKHRHAVEADGGHHRQGLSRQRRQTASCDFLVIV